jgi:hypothetical protein
LETDLFSLVSSVLPVVFHHSFHVVAVGAANLADLDLHLDALFREDLVYTPRLTPVLSYPRCVEDGSVGPSGNRSSVALVHVEVCRGFA